MNTLQALILGIVQGLTEFLPISSSAHLVFFNYFLGVETSDISFEVAVHFGTLISVIFYFRRDLAQVFVDFFRGGPMRKVGWMLLLAMVPTGIIGLGFQDIIEGLFQSPKFAAGGLILTSLFLFTAEKVRAGNRPLNGVRWTDALLIGFLQGLAIIPGISRSGSTISAGLFAGLDRDSAARFSFLLVIPAILGATLLHIGDFASQGADLALPFIVGTLASMISGYLAIGILMAVLRRGRLYGFSAYTAVVGILGLLFLPG